MLSMPRIVRPDPHRFWRARNLGPPLNRPLADPLSETKNCRKSLLGAKGVNRNRELLLIAATFDPRRRRTMPLQCRAC